MSLADIKKKIEADACEEARQIIDRAKEQAARIAADAAQEIDEMKASYDRRFESERPEILRRREIVAKLDVAKISLGAKQRLIDDVYKEALRKLTSLPAGKYISFVETLLSKCAKEGNEKITVGRGDKHLTAAWLKSYNDKHGTRIAFSEDKMADPGGFILGRNRVSENASFEMLVRWLRDDLEADVVKRLFSK